MVNEQKNLLPCVIDATYACASEATAFLFTNFFTWIGNKANMRTFADIFTTRVYISSVRSRDYS